MAELLVYLPIAWAAVAFIVPSNRWRPWLLPLAGLVQLVLAAQALAEPRLTGWDNWLNLDPLGKIFLGLISVLFFLCACYAPGYLAHRQQRDNRVLCACLMLSLAMMTLIIHLGLMWVAMEATTLFSAPGLYFNHNPRSLEATWKYLLICSVGIALALLGFRPPCEWAVHHHQRARNYPSLCNPPTSGLLGALGRPFPGTWRKKSAIIAPCDRHVIAAD